MDKWKDEAFELTMVIIFFTTAILSLFVRVGLILTKTWYVTVPFIFAVVLIWRAL